MAAVIDLTPEVMRKNFMEINYENVKDSSVFIHQQYVEVYERINFVVESEKGEKGEGLKGVFVSGPRGSGKSTIVFNLLKDLEGSSKNLGGKLQVVGEIVDLPSVKISVLVWFLNYLIDLAQGEKADDANVCDDTTLVKLMDLTKKIEVIVRGENMDMWDLVNSSVRKIRKEIGDIARRMLERLHKKFFFLVVDDIDIATGEVIAKFLREVYFFLGEVPLILVGVGDYDNLLKILCVYETGLLGISKTENDICWKTSEKERIVELRVKAKVEKVFGVVHRLKLLRWEREIKVRVMVDQFFIQCWNLYISNYGPNHPNGPGPNGSGGGAGNGSITLEEGKISYIKLRDYIGVCVQYGYLFTEREEHFLLQNLSLRQIVQMLARVEEARDNRKKIKYHELFETIAPDIFVEIIPKEDDMVKRYLLFIKDVLEKVRWVYGNTKNIFASNIWDFMRSIGLSLKDEFILKQYYREFVFGTSDTEKELGIQEKRRVKKDICSESHGVLQDVYRAKIFFFPILFNRVLDIILINYTVVHRKGAKQYDFYKDIIDVIIEFVEEFITLLDSDLEFLFGSKNDSERDEDTSFSNIFVSTLAFYEYLWNKTLPISSENIESLLSEEEENSGKRQSKSKKNLDSVHNALIRAGIFPERRPLGYVGDTLVVKLDYPSPRPYKGIVGSLTIALWMIYYGKVIRNTWIMDSNIRAFDVDEKLFSSLLYPSLADDRRISEIRIRHITFGKKGQGTTTRAIGLELVFLIATAMLYDSLTLAMGKGIVDVGLHRTTVLNMKNVYKDQWYSWNKFIFALYVNVMVVYFERSKNKKEELSQLLTQLINDNEIKKWNIKDIEEWEKLLDLATELISFVYNLEQKILSEWKKIETYEREIREFCLDIICNGKDVDKKVRQLGKRELSKILKEVWENKEQTCEDVKDINAWVEDALHIFVERFVKDDIRKLIKQIDNINISINVCNVDSDNARKITSLVYKGLDRIKYVKDYWVFYQIIFELKYVLGWYCVIPGEILMWEDSYKRTYVKRRIVGIMEIIDKSLYCKTKEKQDEKSASD